MDVLARIGRSALVAVLVVGAAIGCTAPEPDAPPPTAAPSEPAPTPEPAVTVTVAPPAAAEVLLTEQGVGSVALETPGAHAALVELLGEPTVPLDEGCSFWYASWDALTVYFDDPDGATATGWEVFPGRIVDQIRPPFDIYPGDPLGRALDLGAQTVPSYSWVDDTQIDSYITTLGAYWWTSATDDPDAPVLDVSVNSPGCE
jgi:hypothetical protein